MISYVLPTRDRPVELSRTLDAIAALGDHALVGGAEVIVADNASTPAVELPDRLDSGVPVRVIRRERNESAAARNAGVAAADARSSWIVMLDDDSAPMDAGLLVALREAPADAGAISAEIWLEPPAMVEGKLIGRRESGGLPEVFIGCGVALRREVFTALGGYDQRFDYYVEEYDLAARMIAQGWRTHHDPRFRVHHRKSAANRDFGRIIRRLVRNNAWVQQRYAPEAERKRELRETITRYFAIARRERAVAGYLRGMAELACTLHAQRRTPLPQMLYDRLTGLHHARAALQAAHGRSPLGRVALIAPGKNAWCVERALAELGVVAGGEVESADTLVIATMSPGPMLDALTEAAASLPGRRVVAPWDVARRQVERRMMMDAAAA
jgi:GT2 family glycosyltransferase